MSFKNLGEKLNAANELAKLLKSQGIVVEKCGVSFGGTYRNLTSCISLRLPQSEKGREAEIPKNYNGLSVECIF